MMKSTWGCRRRWANNLCHCSTDSSGMLPAACYLDLPTWCIAEEFSGCCSESGRTINRMLTSHPTTLAQPDRVCSVLQNPPATETPHSLKTQNMRRQAIYSHCGPGRKCGLNCAVVQCVYFPLLSDICIKGCDHALHILSPLGGLPPGRAYSMFINVGITAVRLLSAGAWQHRDEQRGLDAHKHRWRGVGGSIEQR